MIEAGKSPNITRLTLRAGFERREHPPMDPSQHLISRRPPQSFWEMAVDRCVPYEAMVAKAAILAFQRRFSELIGK